jgi:hypothetical protein
MAGNSAISGCRLHLSEGAHEAPVRGLGFEVLYAREQFHHRRLQQAYAFGVLNI